MTKKYLLLFVWLLASTTTYTQIITTIAGGNTTGPGDGSPALDCQLNYPSGIAFDGLGNLYIVEQISHRVRKVDLSGIITTIAGTGVAGYSGDGGLATAAQLRYPVGIAVDADNNIYVSDVQNARIRKITPAGIISTYAGNGTGGYSGDGGPATAAQLSGPGYICFDAGGSLYIPENNNNTVRRVDPSGIITTIAGTGEAGFGGDGGPATAAKLKSPYGVLVDKYGVVYISDYSNNRIRRIDRYDTISTIAGTGDIGYNGDGIMASAAQVFMPLCIVADNAGNIYFGDTYNKRVRKIDTSGKISTVAGTGALGYSGDGGPATAARFNTITGLTFDASGNLYIADRGSESVRKVTAVTNVNELNGSVGEFIHLSPNPTKGTFSINSPLQALIPIRITDCLGREVCYQSILPGSLVTLPAHISSGVYVVSGMVNGTPFAKQLSVVR